MRVRDVVKKTAFGVEFVVLGIESQQKIHYAMPLRTMLYDGMGYLKEYREITQTMKKEKGKWTEEEFLSTVVPEDVRAPWTSASGRVLFPHGSQTFASPDENVPPGW